MSTHPITVLLLLTSLFLVSCTSDSPESDQANPEEVRLEQTVSVLAQALTNPGLHATTQAIEEKEYTTAGVLDVLFSTYGAGYWPPPSPQEVGPEHGVEIVPVVREKPTGAWQVVVIPKEDYFLIQGYGESLQKPKTEKKVEFNPSS